MKYQPKPKRKGVRIAFGYYPHPLDPYVLLPDEKKLDALHYAFQMRTKYKTSYRDCAMWLFATTGDMLTHSGFLHLYKLWAKKLRKQKKKEIDLRKAEILKINTNYIANNYTENDVNTNEQADISSLAYQDAQKEFK
jgi:hypothetical protein